LYWEAGTAGQEAGQHALRVNMKESRPLEAMKSIFALSKLLGLV
jgi:hypothetical protein